MNDNIHYYNSIEDVPDAALIDYKQCSKEVKDYIDEALANGARLRGKEPYDCNYRLSLISKELTTRDGRRYYYSQGISDNESDLRDSTFLFFEPEDNVHTEWNCNSQARGINIWNTNQLNKAVKQCPICGNEVDSIDDLESYPYAGYCCKDCIKEAKAEIDSAPNGWWTH